MLNCVKFKLAGDGFYDGVIFHRIIKDFMIQSGDPLSKQIENENQWGTGNAGYTIQAEFNTIKHDKNYFLYMKCYIFW